MSTLEGCTLCIFVWVRCTTVVLVVWRIGKSRSSGRCETLSFSKRR